MSHDHDGGVHRTPPSEISAEAGSPSQHHHHDDDVMPLEDNPIWQQDNVTLHSVGMDIGSSGTQVVFSRLHLRRIGEDLTSRYIVIRRDTLYRSPVRLTPYESDEAVDAEAVGSIIDHAYHNAGVSPEDIDTGVVILTGEALRRRNAGRITEVLAERGGELVCASAGHNMEAMLAAYGSGAARRSHDDGLRLLNVDIGGGTTKLAVIDRGEVVATAALHIGGRLIVVDDERVVRLEPGGREHARRAGYDWALGSRATTTDLVRIADGMAEALVAALTLDPLPAEIAGLLLTDPIDALCDVEGIMFSGGVSEYVYDRDAPDLGDLGPHLGAAIQRAIPRLPAPVLIAGECIRATVLGASEYSVQLSGNTGWISDPDAMLPRRNLQVLRPPIELGDVIDPDEVAASIRAHMTAFDVDHHDPDRDVALALRWSGIPDYQRLAGFARGIVAGVGARLAAGRPLYLVLDGDIARTLGGILCDELGVTNDLLVIDGLNLRDFDYVDIGRVRQPSGTVAVTIKSLVFDEVTAGSALVT